MEDAREVMDLRATYEFLHRHEWIFNFAVTDFFTLKVWDYIPTEWRNSLESLSNAELNQVPFGFIKENWPESLKNFITMATNCSSPRKQICLFNPAVVSNTMKKGMNPKKIHEVSNMAAVIHEMCREHGVKVVIDIGSGLGYLGQVLSATYGYRVIGFESIASRSHGASKRNVKQSKQNKPHRTQNQGNDGNGGKSVNVDIEAEELSSLMETVTLELEDTKQCRQELTKLLYEHCLSEKEQLELKEGSKGLDDLRRMSDPARKVNSSNVECSMEQSVDQSNIDALSDTVSNSTPLSQSKHEIAQSITASKSDHLSQTVPMPNSTPVCMVGLHCCGDLTPTMLRLMRDLDVIQCLVCVSCCYHRMKEQSNKSIVNFPISKTVSETIRTSKVPDWSLTRFAMRLAAQETKARWQHQSAEEHDLHMKHVAYRGLVELYMEKEGTVLKKCHRKPAKKEHYGSFDAYVHGILERSTIEGKPLSEVEKDHHSANLKKLYVENEENFKYIEPITALQVVLQPVLETLITLDRMIFLRENGISAEIKPIFDEYVSPRNLALLANKT
ncbi:unnamed protein product [Owenia fusiformis]|uniref:Uncharacterized protein n=1 Tax=Owenia fusiformis TaxID=6347 RepID=A0A8J1Y3H9_OWEFU|nr:unnamed protein product [Owenia fusiformis]